MTTDKRRIDACLKACKGISTQNLEDNVPVLELARRYNVVLRERDALREQQEINLSDPALQKRLAAQWGYVPAEAQPAPSEQDESVRKAWARFSHELHRSPDAPYPGMADAFEQHFSQSFTDREWRAEASTWAAAWKAAKRHGAQPAPSINDGVRKVTMDFRWESEAQHHIPTIEIEFDPVSPDSPNDAKSWQDRDRLAAMLTPEAKP